MTNKCNTCGKFFASTDGARCRKCNVTYHKQCNKLSPDAKTNKQWMCKTCKPKPCRPVDVDRDRDEDVDIYLDTKQRESSSLVREIRLLRTEISSFRDDMTRLSAIVSEFGSRLESIEDRVTKLEENSPAIRVQEYIVQNEELTSTINELKKKLNDSEQDKLYDTEITGIPESNNENVTHSVITLAQKVGLTLSDCDIVNATRRGPRRPAEEGGTARSRPIVVSLTRRHIRDELRECGGVLTRPGPQLQAKRDGFILMNI
ncbi:unnamed protein product [Leptidea sinapis]|uniref:Phorbol-ester/DAG-type domain-containing protein n=1 Tax=Leptidea sinapis TaxID=189913 RepID=A0A5E4PNR3_9NEOP|nr:unnamed protein product [Leptidea sinapis]